MRLSEMRVFSDVPSPEFVQYQDHHYTGHKLRRHGHGFNLTDCGTYRLRSTSVAIMPLSVESGTPVKKSKPASSKSATTVFAGIGIR